VDTSLGIDLASQNKKTAICVIEWSETGGRAEPPVLGVEQPGDCVGWLVKAALETTWVGIDAPFGWPEAMVEAVSAWHAGEPWADTEPDNLRFRATDRHVVDQTRLRPLSVSSDRIAVVAWRCAQILTALRRERSNVDRVGGGAVFEVYPAAALVCWEIKSRGYKTRSGVALRGGQKDARRAILDQLEDCGPWLDLSAARDVCVENDDALDALITSVVAGAAAKRLTGYPNVEDLDRAKREGWIHLPRRGSLARLGKTSGRRE
jgi:hypothetical protein